jgi:uncharacterized protein
MTQKGDLKLVTIPETVRKAWEDREGPCVFTTVDINGTPNSIYVTCLRIYDDSTIAIANNYFNKTLENIKKGCKGSILFITKERKSYQIKGAVKYETSGEIREFMRECLDPKYPVHGVAVLCVEEVFKGAEKII